MAHAHCMLDTWGLPTPTHNMYYSLLFHCYNGCTNVTQCYVIGTLAVLLFSVFQFILRFYWLYSYVRMLLEMFSFGSRTRDTFSRHAFNALIMSIVQAPASPKCFSSIFLFVWLSFRLQMGVRFYRLRQLFA